jgi:phosphate transporter
MDPQVSWAQWFIVALPVSGISIFLIWLLLLASYRPARSPDGEGDIEIRPIRPTRDSFTLKQYWVIFICLVTISLWCVEHAIHEVVGDMGVIALIPIIAFFSTGVLKKVSWLVQASGIHSITLTSTQLPMFRMTLNSLLGLLYFLQWVESH